MEDEGNSNYEMHNVTVFWKYRWRADEKEKTEYLMTDERSTYYEMHIVIVFGNIVAVAVKPVGRPSLLLKFIIIWKEKNIGPSVQP